MKLTWWQSINCTLKTVLWIPYLKLMLQNTLETFGKHFSIIQSFWLEKWFFRIFQLISAFDFSYPVIRIWIRIRKWIRNKTNLTKQNVHDYTLFKKDANVLSKKATLRMRLNHGLNERTGQCCSGASCVCVISRVCCVDLVVGVNWQKKSNFIKF